MAIGDLRYKGILFGDDFWGTVADEEPPYKNENGVMMKKYLIVPSEDLVEAYPLQLKKQNALNVPSPIGPAIWVEYPVEHIVDENPSRKTAIARVDCGFDGRQTPFTQRFKKLTDQINELQVQNEALRIGRYVDLEEKKEMWEDKKKWAQDIAEMYDIIKGDKNGPNENELPELPGAPI